jgi:hypothetical protein
MGIVSRLRCWSCRKPRLETTLAVLGGVVDDRHAVREGAAALLVLRFDEAETTSF